jgi:hypothetical protein
VINEKIFEAQLSRATDIRTGDQVGFKKTVINGPAIIEGRAYIQTSSQTGRLSHTSYLCDEIVPVLRLITEERYQKEDQ